MRYFCNFNTQCLTASCRSTKVRNYGQPLIQGRTHPNLLAPGGRNINYGLRSKNVKRKSQRECPSKAYCIHVKLTFLSLQLVHACPVSRKNVGSAVVKVRSHHHRVGVRTYSHYCVMHMLNTPTPQVKSRTVLYSSQISPLHCRHHGPARLKCQSPCAWAL